jgi:hypothetical protein
MLSRAGWSVRGQLTRTSTRFPLRSTSLIESLLERDMMSFLVEYCAGGGVNWQLNEAKGPARGR